ncbi:MAG: heavy metal translocating P-type ATPase metal-binding domain-containing protein [Candidatus Kapaibacteriales bacterium]
MPEQDIETSNIKTSAHPACKHCGEPCYEVIAKNENQFCCVGCSMVFELLEGAGLNSYYDKNLSDNKSPGIKGETSKQKDYSYLDEKSLQDSLLSLKTENRYKVSLTLPSIHCSACIYLLENLPRLNSGIIESRVDFLEKESTIIYSPKQVKFSEIASLLAFIGYRPLISLDSGEKERAKAESARKELKKLYLKIGVAFFCFGNIMMLALPEYLSGGGLEDKLLGYISYAQLILSLPLLYSMSGYFKSAIGGLKAKNVNLDVPISLGALSLFLRSAYEIISQTGAGYLDSLAGLAFFLLIGRLFQEKTYQGLSFSRDHSSFFPLSVTRLNPENKNNEQSKASIHVKSAKVGDTLVFRHSEIVPMQCLAIDDSKIDYSFVTGEAEPISVSSGEIVYPGGRIVSGSVRASVMKSFDQAYLNSLWQSKNSKTETLKEGTGISKLSDTIAKWFTLGVLIIGLGSFLYWSFEPGGREFEILAAVLIVACPCALALSMPFTYGTVMRFLGKFGLYLKKDFVIEDMAQIDTIVLDKTGTLSESGDGTDIDFIPESDNNLEEVYYPLYLITLGSSHPISRQINKYCKKILNESGQVHLPEYQGNLVNKYEEQQGKGIKGHIKFDSKEYEVFVGSKEWIGNIGNISEGNSIAYISINGQYIGYFKALVTWRKNIDRLTDNSYLDKKHIWVVSGDDEKDKMNLTNLGFREDNLIFRQKPNDKTRFIDSLQNEKKKVLMAGDGLNDVGALSQANVGIAITDNTTNFTPNSDGILIGDKISKLFSFLQLARKARTTVFISLVISLLYNVIGLYFAITGQLSPVFAAILMPVSSITVVAFTVGKSTLDSKISLK